MDTRVPARVDHIRAKRRDDDHQACAERSRADAARQRAAAKGSEVSARGQVFVGEALYPKGSPSPDPTTTLTNDELSAKFAITAEGVLSSGRIEQVLDRLWHLDEVDGIASVMTMLSNHAST